MLRASVTFASILNNLEVVINQAIGVLFVLATLVFLWGVIQYIIAAGNQEKIKEARGYIVYGIVGLFMMVAVWGIVAALIATFFGSSLGSNPRSLPGNTPTGDEDCIYLGNCPPRGI